MKTQIKRFSKSTLAVVLSLCMLMSCMTVGIIATDAAKIDSESVGALSVAGKIYFIKPDDWSYAALAIGHSSYSDCYQMSNISGTKLYYVKRDSAWSDSTEFAFFDVNGWGSEGHSVTHRAAYASHASTVNSSYAMNAGSTYLIPTTANSPTYYSAGYSAMNKTLTVKTMLKSGSSYAETSTKCGTFSASNAKKLSGDGASASSSISQTNGTATLETARTNTATVSQTAVSGYTFKGWKTSKDTTGSGLSTGDYSFTNSGSAATVYAYYEPATTTYSGVKAAASPAGVATVSPDTGQSVVSTTGVQVSFSDFDERYKFTKWTSSNGTFGSVGGSSTSTTTNPTFYPTANNATATANFSEKSGTLTISNTSTKGTPSYESSKTVKAVTTTALPTVINGTGYTFTGWKVTNGTVYVGNTTYTTSSTGLIAGGTAVNLRANATVTAQYTTNKHAVSYANSANQYTITNVKDDGTAITSGTEVEYGSTVTYTVTGNTQTNQKYVVTGVTVTDATGAKYNTSTGAGQFTMPDAAVTIQPVGKYQYKVTYSTPANCASMTVKNGNTNVTSGSFVDADTSLTVTLKTNSGYELNNAGGVTFNAGTGASDGITYTGSITVNGAKTIAPTAKALTQYTVTLQNGTNVTGYKVSYTKNKATVSNADYSSAITVDAGTNVTITATPKGRATVTKWTVNNTDEASTSTTKTITAIAANTTASATAAKSDDVIYVIPHSDILGGNIYYYTWNSSDSPTSGSWPGTKIWNGSSVPSTATNVQYDSASGAFIISGLTSGESIKFTNNSGTETGNKSIEYGKTYKIETGSWAVSVKSLGDPTDETVIFVNKEVIAKTYTKTIGGSYIYYGDYDNGTNKVFGNASSCNENLKNNSLPSGISLTTTQIENEDYWKITIPNYKFTGDSGKFNIKFFVYDWNPSDTDINYDLTVGHSYKFDVALNSSENGWNVAEEEVDDEGGGGGETTGNSDYYLDGYTHTNNNPFSYVETKRMFTATLGAGTYSYYKVNTLAYSGHGDTGLSLFAVKTPEDAALATTGTNKYLYLLGSDTFGKNDCYVGYSTDGTNFTEKNMSLVANNGSNKIWKYPVPSNTTKIYFKTIVDGTEYYASNNGANYTVASGEKMAYQVYGSGTFTKVAWNADGYTDVLTQGEDLGGTAGSGHYYVWNTDNAYVTTTPNEDLFQSDGLLQNSGYDDGKSAFDLPFHTGTTKSGYYVIVIHPNTNYRFTKEDGTVLTYNNTSNHPIIYTSSVLPGVEMPPTPVRAIYAKDGALRNGYQRFSEFGTTEITQILDTNGTDVTSSFASSHARKDWTDGADGKTDYDYVENIPFGYTIKWTTTLGTDKYDGTNQFKNSHYVRGFSVNGVTEELFEYSNTGVYTGTHVVNNEDCRRGHIEITPVYWLKNATYTKTFYVTGFDRTNTAYRELGWGDELGIYPYYENVNGADNAFGGYPGQPMIFYKGTYVQQIPTTVTGLAGGAQIKGMTLSNNYWDLLHRSVNGSDPIYPVNHHRQTYDFDDFYEIANEQKPDSITFSYRLRTVNDNFGDTAEQRNTLAVHTDTVNLSDYENTTTHNGTEIYKDALDRQIDLFGTVLTSTQASHDPLLVITNGYKNTYVGKYATEWAVYKKEGSTYRYITSISPSALEVKSSANLSKYGAGAYTAAYTALEAYRGVPVKISFEKSMENSTGDIADRLDGRWYYTKAGDQVEANIVIQYDDGNGYVSDDFTAPTGDDRNLGSHTGARAYFTNVTPNDIYGDVTSGKTTLTADTQYFNLKAEESANYQFVGWYQMQDNQYVPMEQEQGVTETHTIIKSNETYYARFKKITSGTLSVKHIIQNGTISGTNYNGTGTPYLSVQITDTDGTVVANFPKATGSSFIHSKYIRSLYANYNIKVTIQTDPDEENVFQTYALTGHSGDKFITPTSGSLTSSSDCVFEFKVADLFDNTLSSQTVTSLEYVSRLTKTEYTYDYQIDYVFPSRYWNEQTYRVTGSIAANRVSNFVEGKQTSAKLKQSVLQTLTPYESQFRKVISWGYTAGYNNQTSTLLSGTNYKISTTITANFDENELVHAEFKLPYEYDKTTEHYTAIERDFYSTTPAYEDKTEEYYRGIYQNDVSGEPSVTEYGKTPIAPTATQTTTKVDGDSSGVGYSTNYSSFTLASEVGRTFNTDNSVTTDRSAMKMVTAPDYVYKVNGTDNVAYHTYRVAAYYYSYNAGEQGYHYGYKDFNDGIIANNLQKKYFTRWDIYVDGKVINSCYSKEFNYTAYQDIVVVPVYESDSPSANVTGAAGQGAVANITFLGTTRNQWNVEGLGDSQVQVKKNGVFVNVTATDRLFADFDVDLAYNNKVFRDIDGTVAGNMRFETGVVIQQLGDLSGRGTDSVDTNATTYANMYKDQYDATAMAAWINTGSGSKGDSFTTVKSVIGDNYGADVTKRLDKNHELISNKNTVEYCYYLTKSRSLKDGTSNTYENNYSRAYRAIAYVKYSTDDGATWTTAVSSTPAYFTIYDEAIRVQ